MTESQRKNLWYVAACGIFWFGALSFPSKVTYQFYKYDYLHLYNHLFYFFLAVVGLLIGVTRAAGWKKRILLALVAGEASAYLSFMVIGLQQTGLDYFVMTHAVSLLLVQLRLSLMFGAPLWAVLVAVIFWKLTNRSHAQGESPESKNPEPLHASAPKTFSKNPDASA